MSRARAFKNWMKMIPNAIEEFGEKVVQPGMAAMGKAAGKIAAKPIKGTYNLAKNQYNKLKDIDTEELGKTIKKKGKEIGASGAYGAMNEFELIGDSMNLIKHQMLGDAPITKAMFGADNKLSKILSKTATIQRTDKNMLGYKFTGLGAAALVPASLVAGTPDAYKEFTDMYRGQSDGQLYTNAPINTYGKALGNSYANNAGATGDLVFALHNQRHSGII